MSTLIFNLYKMNTVDVTEICHVSLLRLTLAISRKIFNFPRNDLQSLIVRFGLQSQVAHQASYDAFNTFQILE